MTIHRYSYIISIITIAFCFGYSRPGSASPGPMDTDLAWPLCGRITEAPPTGWTDVDGCPSTRWGDPDYSDFPLNSTFGPRVLSAGYDYHQGLDISTPSGTPVFAMTDGVVLKAGNYSGYEDPLITVRHYRPGFWGSCSGGGGCYHTYYMHLSSWVVSEDEIVAKGQLIGYTGASSTGYQHLHFEIRDAPAWDATSAWNRDAIHPLSALAYHRDIADTQVSISSVDTADPGNPLVALRVLQLAADKTWDIVRVEVEVYDLGTGLRMEQPGEVPNADDYHVHPPFFDMVQRTFEYSHKDSSSFPWKSFKDCPYASDHGRKYDSDLHVSQTEPGDGDIGLFNGIRVDIPSYSSSSADYDLNLEFQGLASTADAASLCVKARAINASGEATGWATWNC